MSAHLVSNRVRIIDQSETTTVSFNPKARLMYYLYCVSRVLRTDNLEKYTDYKNFENTPDSEIDEILDLARIFNPKAMVEAGVFKLEENIDAGNKFLKITNEQTGIHADQEIFIGGITVRVLQLMLFKMTWLQRNYLEPYEKLSRREQLSVVGSFRNNNFVYSRPKDPLEQFQDCSCDCIIF